MIIVDHKMPFLLSLCSRFVVLEQGSQIADGKPLEVLADKRVATVFLGSRNNDVVGE
jgi:branched-chain amino acid transport system ATP-binding protein